MRPPFGFCRRRRFAQCHQFGISLGVTLPALALAPLPPLALAGTAQLRNRHGLVELGDRAEREAEEDWGR
jgi:hypothetical protein